MTGFFSSHPYPAPGNYTTIPSNLHPYSLKSTPLFHRHYTLFTWKLHTYSSKLYPYSSKIYPYSSIPTSLFLNPYIPIPQSLHPYFSKRHPYFSEGGGFPYIWIMNNLPKCLALPKSQSLRIPLSGSRSKFWGLISLNNIQSKSYLSKLTVDMIIIYTRFSGMFNSQWYPWKPFIIENEWDIYIFNFQNWLFSIFIYLFYTSSENLGLWFLF